MPQALPSNQWPWRSTKPGVTMAPDTSTISAPDPPGDAARGATTPAIRPSRTTTSRSSSMPCDGSTTRPPARTNSDIAPVPLVGRHADDHALAVLVDLDPVLPARVVGVAVLLD